MPPTLGNGKICYIGIPAKDAVQSAEFYAKIFGWKIEKRGDGRTTFTDSVGQVSGVWTEAPLASADAGLQMYIMVADVAKTLGDIEWSGCEVVQPVDPNAREITARFRDPAGNIIGIYQEQSLSQTNKA
jgi:predicted enzyme related to lactoylglutathione lyase